jgi:flagellar hook-length control protein FliK
MDVAQIMMMPVAASAVQVPALSAADASGSQFFLTGQFSEMLVQNLAGVQSATNQSSVAQTTGQSEIRSAVDSISALTKELAEQNVLATEPDLTVAEQLNAYAQLAVFQTILPVQQQQVDNTLMETPEKALVELAAAVNTESQTGQKIAVDLIPSEQIVSQPVVSNQLEPAGKQAANVQQKAEVELVSAAKGSVQPKAEAEISLDLVLAAKSTVVPQKNPESLSFVMPGGAQNVAGERTLPLDEGMKADVVPQAVKKPETAFAVLQKASETQPVPQEVTAVGTKATTVVQQPVRFAQQPDVVLAAAGSEGQGSATSDQQNQGSRLMSKASESLTVQTALVKSEPAGETATLFRMPDQHGATLHVGQQVVNATNGEVPEAVKAAPQELVGRQVAERLTSHEIKQGNDQISLKLSPENLGNLQLNMRMDDNRLKLEIVAESRGVRDALLQQADELKETLARQNIKVDSFNVTTGNNGNQSQQQSMDWRQMTQEQRQYQPHYASVRVKGGAVEEVEATMKYFVPQYQSTLDVRF